MPVLAVVGAGAAIFGAVTMTAAATSVIGILTIVGAVGATIGAVGAVTGNKTLQKVGLGLGLVGGLGALAASAGIFGAKAADATASLFGSSANVASDAGASTNIIDALGGVDSIPSSVAITPSQVGTIGADGLVNVGGVTPGILNSASVGGVAGLPSPPTAPSLTPGADATAGLSPLPSTPAATPAVTGAAPPPVTTGADIASSTPAVSGSVADAGGKSALSGIMAFADKHPWAAFGAVQAAGSFLSGATNPITPAQVETLEAQAALNRAATALHLTQQANMAAPLPVASRTKAVRPQVTGVPAGLINTPPPGTVTGMPA